MKPRRLRATIVHGNTDQQVLRPIFRVLDKYVKVAVLIEDSGIKKFIFEILPGAALVGFNQIQIREFALRILVEVLHVGVSGSAVNIEVVLLHVFAMIAFAVGKPEETLLQDGIPLIPQRERETEPLAVVGNPSEAVFSPSISARSGLVVRKVVPGIAIIAVILANRPPLPLAEIGTPLLPGHMGLAGFIQTLLFRSFDELGFHGAQSPSVVRTGPWRALHVHFRLGRTMLPREFAGRLQSPCMPFVLVMDARDRSSVGLKKHVRI